MKKTVLIAIISLFGVATFPACDTLKGIANDVLAEPTLDEIGRGLKEALTNGISKGVDVLSAKDGYFKSAYKILLPPEARKVTERLKVIPGFEKLEDNLIERINRGAEDAAKEAKPIFVSAIRSMTFSDATKILMGTDNAATDYLNRTTNQQLYDKFNPKIVASLDKVGANDLWRKAAEAYNKIPLLKDKVNTDLDDYITREALKGLFSKVEDEEKSIRNNKLSRSSALLKKVFAKQDANRTAPRQ
jgi:predicted small secreted protein